MKLTLLAGLIIPGLPLYLAATADPEKVPGDLLIALIFWSGLAWLVAVIAQARSHGGRVSQS